jgi:hypothetical protein
VHFSAMPSDDWPTIVDARSSSPQRQSSSGVDEERSYGPRGEEEGERTAYVREKLQGKRPAEDEPSSRRKKTSSSSRRDEEGVNIGGPTPQRRRRLVVSDSSDDDGAAIPLLQPLRWPR